MPKKKPKIYVFLNRTSGKVAQWAAVAEDGACLAACNVPAGMPGVVRIMLGENSKPGKTYRQYYPHGYKLIWIENINAAENFLVMHQLREATTKFVQRMTGFKASGI